jgi:ADP-ribosyl-[dinitrogen reductase] hydrolase
MRGAPIVEPLIARLIREASHGATDASAGRGAPPGARTSASHPIRVDWVDLGQVPHLRPSPGRLGMTFAPGKRDPHGKAGVHWRDLATDLARLRDHHEATRLVLLLEDHELATIGIEDIPTATPAHGIELLRFPIPDGGVPADPVACALLVERIIGWVDQGEHVVIACRGGLGRTGTIAGCVLRQAGLDGPEAIELTRASRAGTIENDAQEAYVTAWGP